MTDPTAADFALTARNAYQRAALVPDEFAEPIAAALVAIALHLTEPAPDSAADDGQPCCAKSDAGYLCTRAIGHAGQHEADDGERTVDTWPAAEADAETRQPTGLQRLTQPEPLTVTVEPNEWMVTISGKPERFITLTDEGEYATARDATHPTLADAVAAIVKAAS